MTNFHLPHSTLFMLVSAFFRPRRPCSAAYAHAIAAGYRFYSYGDASLLLHRGAAELDLRHPHDRFASPFTLLEDRWLAPAAARSRSPRGADPHAGLHAGRHRRRPCKAMYARPGARARRRHHPRQHLSPDAAGPAPSGWRQLGGLHAFANWPHPILTDSGGFQVMSLARSSASSTSTASPSQSHIDGRRYELTPERSVEIQALLDSDIQMQLDECVALPAEREEIERAMQLSLRWAERSKAAFGDAAGQGDLRHRAGRRQRAAARGIGERAR